VLKFIKKKIGDSGVDYEVFEKVHVNGNETHPVFHFLRQNAPQTGRGSRMVPLPWNFSKFLVDKEGRVFSFYSPGTAPSAILPDIKALLDGSKQGEANLPPNVTQDQAPAGFGPYTPKL